MHRYIPDSPGARVPEWMDAEEAAEYRATSPEYAHDLRYVPDPDIYDDPMDDDRYDFVAEQQAAERDERLEQARREAEEIPLEELEAAAEILQREIERRKEEN